MAAEKPEIGFDVEVGADQSFSKLPAILVYIGDTIEHQHRRQRQLSVSRSELFPPDARQQPLIIFAAAPVRHAAWLRCLASYDWSGERDVYAPRSDSAPEIRAIRGLSNTGSEGGKEHL